MVLNRERLTCWSGRVKVFPRNQSAQVPGSGDTERIIPRFFFPALALTFRSVWFHGCGLAFGNTVSHERRSVEFHAARGGKRARRAAGARHSRFRERTRPRDVAAATGLAAGLGFRDPDAAHALVDSPWLINLPARRRISRARDSTTAMGATLPFLPAPSAAVVPIRPCTRPPWWNTLAPWQSHGRNAARPLFDLGSAVVASLLNTQPPGPP